MMEQAVFPPDLHSAKAARRFVRDTLDRYGLAGDVPVLLVSELATNAVLHARTDFAVRIVLRDGVVRTEVQDANERPPVIGHTPTEATSGRGLHLVQRMAQSWGVEGRPEGKIVWFEVAVPAADRVSVAC